MNKPIGRLVRESWGVFTANLVLFLPPVIISFVNMIFYGALILIFIVLCFHGFSGANFDPETFRFGADRFNLDEIRGFIARFLVYIIGTAAIVIVYNLALGIIHGAGWLHMFARAAVTGRTRMSDYLDGIGKFAGRMVWLTIVRSALLGIPPLALLVLVAAVVMRGGSDVAAKAALLLIVGLFLVGPLELFLGFFLWMWRPAMFTRDLPVVEALIESISFTRRRFGGLFIIGFLWIAFTLMLGSALGGFNGAFFGTLRGERDFAALMLIVMAMMIGRMVVWAVMFAARVYFVILYYKFYYDESSPATAAAAAAVAPPDYRPPARQYSRWNAAPPVVPPPPHPDATPIMDSTPPMPPAAPGGADPGDVAGGDEDTPGPGAYI